MQNIQFDVDVHLKELLLSLLNWNQVLVSTHDIVKQWNRNIKKKKRDPRLTLIVDLIHFRLCKRLSHLLFCFVNPVYVQYW